MEHTSGMSYHYIVLMMGVVALFAYFGEDIDPSSVYPIQLMLLGELSVWTVIELVLMIRSAKSREYFRTDPGSLTFLILGVSSIVTLCVGIDNIPIDTLTGMQEIVEVWLIAYLLLTCALWVGVRVLSPICWIYVWTHECKD